jgi:hypothetical protein
MILFVPPAMLLQATVVALSVDLVSSAHLGSSVPPPHSQLWSRGHQLVPFSSSWCVLDHLPHDPLVVLFPTGRRLLLLLLAVLLLLLAVLLPNAASFFSLSSARFLQRHRLLEPP